MTLRKTIEFPLFHVGQFVSQDGTEVPITDALLRQVEKNTNFILKSKVLQAPIGYDHPAKKSDAHGTLVGTRYHNGVLYAQGTNWSDDLVADVKAMKKLAYSGELAPNFTYPKGDGTGSMVKLGPAVVGMAILGSQRPAIKNLKPLSEFEFAETIAPADAFETREELRSAGLVSQHVDGTQFFGEVDNDERRFDFQEDLHMPLTDAERAQIVADVTNALKPVISDSVTAVAKPLQDQIKNFSEESKRVAAVDAKVDKLKKEKPLGQIALDAYRVALLDPNEANVQAFAEKLPAFIAPGGVAGTRKGKDGAEGGDTDEEGDEPKALAAIRQKHFAEMDDPRNQTIIEGALQAFGEFKPDAFKGVESNPAAQLDRLRNYVAQRDTGAAAN